MPQHKRGSLFGGRPLTISTLPREMPATTSASVGAWPESQRKSQGPRGLIVPQSLARAFGRRRLVHIKGREVRRVVLAVEQQSPGRARAEATPVGLKATALTRDTSRDRALPAFLVVEPGKASKSSSSSSAYSRRTPFTRSIRPSSSLSSSSSLRCDTRNLATKTCCWTW